MQRFKVKQLMIDLPQPGPEPDPGCGLISNICFGQSCPPCPPPVGCEGPASQLCQALGMDSLQPTPPTECPGPPSFCDNPRISPHVEGHLREFAETQDLDLLRVHLRELETKLEPQTLEEIELVQASLSEAQRELRARKRRLLKQQAG